MKIKMQYQTQNKTWNKIILGVIIKIKTKFKYEKRKTKTKLCLEPK